jgi:hypothetical protein
MVIVALVGGVAFTMGVLIAIPPRVAPGTREPPGDRDPQQRVVALAKLLARNEIRDLPPNFNFWADTSRIMFFTAKDKTGTVFKLVQVEYYVDPEVSETCSFVFDRGGRCIFWSRDLMGWFANGGLLDVNNDGHVDKIVEFTIDAMAPPGTLNHRLQIFKLSTDGHVKLLDVGYTTWTAKDPSDLISANLLWSGVHGGYIIRLTRGPRADEELLITWSAEKQAFVAEGAESPYWKVFPIEDRKAGPCPFHPEMFVERGKSCPVCGYPGREAEP